MRNISRLWRHAVMRPGKGSPMTPRHPQSRCRGLVEGQIVIAPDKFKGSLTARQAAQAMSRGVNRAHPRLTTVECPVADGGDGTLEAVAAAGFGLVPVSATGPTGRAVRSAYARRGNTAVIEMADICGLL